MSKLVKKRDKWHLLRLGARWDRSTVPIYEAAARGRFVPLLKTLLTTHCRNECAYWRSSSMSEMPKNDMGARKDIGIRYSADLERIIGANLTRRVNQYVDLKVGD